MAKYKMLIPLEKNIELFAGEITSIKIMEGSEALTEKADKRSLLYGFRALWSGWIL